MLFSKTSLTRSLNPKKKKNEKKINGKFILVLLCNSFQFPVAERGAMFLFANGDKDVFEVAVFAESCRSWLIDNTVQQGKEAIIFFKLYVQ